jgi:hypothetical protein
MKTEFMESGHKLKNFRNNSNIRMKAEELILDGDDLHIGKFYGKLYSVKEEEE